MNARKLALLSLVGVLGACVVASWSASALASEEYVPAGTFGEACSSEPCGPGQFKEPSGVAVNSANEPLVQPGSGDVYVIDAGDERVERFSATGSYLGQFNGAGSFEAEGKTQTGPRTPAGSLAFSKTRDADGIAVDGSTSPLDSSAGDVYVADVGHSALDKFSPLGSYEGQLLGTCPKPGTCTAAETIPFPGELRGVAVDPAGNVWVYLSSEGQNVDEFSDTGAFVQSVATGQPAGPGFGVDANDDIYAVLSYGGTAEFSKTGEMLAGAFGRFAAVALGVDAANSEVFIDQASEQKSFIERFGVSEAGPSRLQTFGTLSESRGLAVNGTSNQPTLYASQSIAGEIAIFKDVLLPAVTTGPASEVARTRAQLTGVINPEGLPLTDCEFEYGTTSAYGHQVPCEQALGQIGEGSTPVAVSADVSVHHGIAYHYRLVGTNQNGTKPGSDAEFATYPNIEGEMVSYVGPGEAELQAKINAAGQLTGYYVEYGESEAYGTNTAEVSLGAPGAPVNVSLRLQNLSPDTHYYARIDARTSLGVVSEGAGVSFTTTKTSTIVTSTGSSCPNRTFAGFNTALPDCRAYELVSDDIDEAYVPEYGEPGPEAEQGGGTGEYKGAAFGDDALYRAAADGEGLIYMGGESNSGVGGNGSTSNGAGNQYLSTRGANGWKATDISLPINGAFSSLFEAFSEDLSVQLFQADTPPSEPLEAQPQPLPECIEHEAPAIYSHDSDGLHALVGMNHGSGACYGRPDSISADDSHLLFEAGVPYTEEAKQASGNAQNLYDSVHGVLRQVNVLPDGEAEQAPDASLGSLRYGEGGRGGSMIGAISADGSRIFWTEAEDEGGKHRPKALYVRENDTQPQSPVTASTCTVPADACTVQLDAAQGGSGASGGGYFWAATDNSNRVFFTDCSRLTADSTAHGETACIEKQEESSRPKFTGNDLYEYDFEKPVGQRLTDLTVDHNPGDPLGANVQGVVGTSEDGSYVYIVADGVLAGSNAEGKAPVAGQPNLYELHGGSASFVVTLASSDQAIVSDGSFTVGDWQPTPGERTAQVSPSGDAVAFLSRLELTGYDNYGIVGYDYQNGKPNLSAPNYAHIPELFVYQARTGRMVCASCSPTGSAPIPLDLPRATLPGTTLATSTAAAYVSHWLVDREGTQAYFMTTQPLVADDSNGLMDVYEWQSEGSGGCGLASGCLSLISSAEQASNAFLLGSGASGRDVFFTSRSQLTKGSEGESLKVYDARVDGGRAEPSLSCTGTGCQGIPPAPPIFATPSSVTFNGVGNFEPSPPLAVKAKSNKKARRCRAGFHRKHGQCVRSRPRKLKRKRPVGKTLTRRGR